MIYRILALITFLLFYHIVIANNPDDSLKFKNKVGICLGFQNYASIDNIQTPFIYKGNSVGFEIRYLRQSAKTQSKLTIYYSDVRRTPQNVHVPEYYYLKAIEKNQKLKITPERRFQYLENYLLDIRYLHQRKVVNNLIFNDYISIGCNLGCYAVLEKEISEFEIFSLSLSPSVSYQCKINSRFSLELQFYTPFISSTLRLPYANAIAQLNERTTSSAFEYLTNNSKINSFNKYLQINTVTSLNMKLTNRSELELEYSFIYINCKEPRPLYIVSSNINLGFNFKF